MRFVLVIYHLWSGGAEKQVLLTARALVRLGHECEIISLAPGDGSPQAREWVRRAVAAGVRCWEPGWLEGCARMSWFRVWRAVQRPATVVWSWGYRADLLCKSLTSVAPSCLLVCSLRGSTPGHVGGGARLARFRHRRVAAYVSNSHRALNLLEELVPGVRQRGFVLPNAWDEPFPDAVSLASEPKEWTVVMLGNIRRHVKGYDLVVQAAERISQMGLPIRFRIGGRPDEADWLRGAVASARVEDRVEYVGPVSDSAAFLRSGHVFLLASRCEGLPNTLLEAMSQGLPSVATRVGDLGEWGAHPHALRLIEAGSMDAIVEALRSCIKDWPGTLKMGLEGRTFVQTRFSAACLEERLRALTAVLGTRWTAGEDHAAAAAG